MLLIGLGGACYPHGGCDVTDISLHTHERALEMSLAAPGDFFALLKPRVMVLVVFTALVGLVSAPGAINPIIAAIAILAIGAGGGASGALNMWYEAAIDAKMARTASRPIPAGLVASGEALGFALVLAGLSVMVLGLATNWFAAAFLAFTIFFYAVVYTMVLKPRTAQNIVIGGAAGAFPPMIGWAAVTGSVSLESFVQFAIIFMWTPPHFWALALVKSDDYARAGVPMLPNVAGAAATRLQIMIYSALLAPLGMVPLWLGHAGWLYGSVALMGGLGFVWHSWRVLRVTEGKLAVRACWKLFGFSIFYLFGLFGALLVDKTLHNAGLI